MAKYKKIIGDVILNVVATAIPLVMLQLIVLPIVALKTTGEHYGLILTIISLVTVCSGSLGNALNNIRLIENNKYLEKGFEGDFQILLLIEVIIASIIIFVINNFAYHGASFFVMILGILWLIREYYIVAFRLKLDFWGIVINNLIMIIGYVLGLILFWFTGIWEFIYIFGMFFSLAYVFSKSRIAKEKFAITSLFKGTSYKLILLVIAAVINNLLNYADRMIIYPLIGGTAVSIYYASTLFGKLVGTAVSPLNSVILSYVSKKNKLNKNILFSVLAVSTVVAIIGYIICRIIAYPVLSIIYPQLADQSIQYVPITTAIAMMTMMISVLSPFVLKFCDMKWQVIINISVLIIYLLSSISLFNIWGLHGFCCGVLISNLIKLVIMTILGIETSKERTKNE